MARKHGSAVNSLVQLVCDTAKGEHQDTEKNKIQAQDKSRMTHQFKFNTYQEV